MEDTSRKRIAENALSRAKELMSGSGNENWTIRREDKNGVRMTECEVEGQPIKCMKVVGHVPNADAADLAEKLWMFGFEEWQQMENGVSTFEAIEMVEGIGEKCKVCYQVNSLPWPLTARDTVALWTLFKEDGVFYFVATSIEHPERPEQPKKYVRNSLILGAWILESVDGGVEVTRIMHINPSGSIPKVVVQKGNEKVFFMIPRFIEIALHSKEPIQRSKKLLS